MCAPRRWRGRDRGRSRSRPSRASRVRRPVGRRRRRGHPRPASPAPSRPGETGPSPRARPDRRGAPPRARTACLRPRTTSGATGSVRLRRSRHALASARGRPCGGSRRRRHRRPIGSATPPSPRWRTEPARRPCRGTAARSRARPRSEGDRASACAAAIHRAAFHAETPYRIDTQWATSRAPSPSQAPLRSISASTAEELALPTGSPRRAARPPGRAGGRPRRSTVRTGPRPCVRSYARPHTVP